MIPETVTAHAHILFSCNNVADCFVYFHFIQCIHDDGWSWATTRQGHCTATPRGKPRVLFANRDGQMNKHIFSIIAMHAFLLALCIKATSVLTCIHKIYHPAGANSRATTEQYPQRGYAKISPLERQIMPGKGDNGTAGLPQTQPVRAATPNWRVPSSDQQ